MSAQQVSRLEAALSKAKEEINELRAKNMVTELKASELNIEAKTAALKAETQNAHKVKEAYDEGFASAQAVYKDMLNRMETAAKNH
jgi:cell division protein FtsB